MKTEVKRTLLGSYVVKFDCPGCSIRLTSPLTDAGTVDSCPDCGKRFKVPAEKALEKWNQKNASEKQEKERVALASNPPVCAPEAEVVEAIVVEPEGNDKLIGCPDCGNSVSRRAAACPNCGAPVAGPLDSDNGESFFDALPPSFPSASYGNTQAYASGQQPLHPEVERFLDHGDSIPIAHEYEYFYDADRVWGTSSVPNEGTSLFEKSIKTGASGMLCFVVGGFVGEPMFLIGALLLIVAFVMLLLTPFLPDKNLENPYKNFEVVFSASGKRWTSNDEQFWRPIRKFFKA